MSGTVYLIGSGPGDPGLLTLRGAQLLARADVVLYDGLSNVQMLCHAPAAQHICVGKHGQSRIWRQDEVIAEILLHAQAGKRVARLKGGDPAVFARTAEEVEALQDAGIPFEIVPGITAALAAGSFAGIPITHRGLASAVALVTGHEEPSKMESALDWTALARFPGTLVIYMGVTTVKSWTTGLLQAGKPADTPTAIVRRCSLPDQETFHCRLDQVADQLQQFKIRPPVITIIGPVTELATTMNWIQQRPLVGQTVLVTRPADQAEALAGPLREQGANVLLQPAIEIGPPDDWADVDQAISELASFDKIVFCSHNGVKYFMDRLSSLGGDSRGLAGLQIATVGSKTAAALQPYGLTADFVPTDFKAESLASELRDHVQDQRVLEIRASRGRDAISETLTAAGATVRQIVAYRNCDVQQAKPEVIELARAGKIDWVTVTSSASAASLVNLFGDSMQQMKIASLSPVTSKTLDDLGCKVAVEANPYTIDSLVKSLTS